MEEELFPIIRDRGIRPVLAAPLSEMFSIDVFPNSFEEHGTCAVYGEINIIDEDGTSYLIYSLDYDEAEIITSKNTALSIWVPEKCSLSTTWSRLSIQLMTGNKETFVEKDVKLPKITDFNFDEVKILAICGAKGRVCFKYTTFLAAVFCYVQVIISKDTTTDMEKTDLYGKIIASYSNTYTREFPQIVLFEEMPDSPYSLDFPQTSVGDLVTTSIDLDRDRVVVPAFSFFGVDVELYSAHSHEVFFKGKAEFRTKFFSLGTETFKCKGFSIEIELHWGHRYQMAELLKCSQELVSIDQGINTECKDDTLELTEVFAVLVCHSMKGIVEMCGKLLIEDGDIMIHAPFDRSLSVPKDLSNRATIPLEGPSKCYVGHDSLAMGIDLWDTQREVLVKGNLTFLRESLVSPTSFYDKRICSVVKGINCYACIFYSMLTNAVEARIEVLFEPRGVFKGMRHVYGAIVAKYSNEDYSSEYEKYYQSTIWNSSERCLPLKSSGNVPLLKSVVAVPTTSSLIVEVDLKVVYGESTEYLQSMGEFDFKKGIIVAPKIDGISCSFNLSVKWSGKKERYSKNR